MSLLNEWETMDAKWEDYGRCEVSALRNYKTGGPLSLASESPKRKARTRNAMGQGAKGHVNYYPISYAAL